MGTLPQQLSIATYNIHKGFGIGKVRFLLPEMRSALTALNADFIFLQEVQGEHKRRERRIHGWPVLPQIEYLAEKIGPHSLYSKNAIYQSGHHGNAILSKYAFARFENINLSTIARASRSVLHGQIKLNDSKGTTIHLLCVHLGLFKAERAIQCKALMERIRYVIPENEPILMAGDFNDWRQRLSQPLAEELGIKEAFFHIKGAHAKSFPAIKPALCVDRIYFRGLRLVDVQSLHGKPWNLLSDHIPLQAYFELE